MYSLELLHNVFLRVKLHTEVPLKLVLQHIAIDFSSH